jgi:hypothetical protein
VPKDNGANIWEAMRMARLRLVGLVAMIAVATLISVSTSALAGGASLTAEDISAEDSGLPFIGFVRAVDGAGVSDAKVTAELHGGALVTATDILGLYKLPGFGKSVNPEDVKISCAKDGYKQANVVRRAHAGSDTSTPVEVDCYLQKQ